MTDSDSNNNITMETKVVGDKNTEDVTTTIECINDTKFQSIRSVRQLKDHSGKNFKDFATLRFLGAYNFF